MAFVKFADFFDKALVFSLDNEQYRLDSHSCRVYLHSSNHFLLLVNNQLVSNARLFLAARCRSHCHGNVEDSDVNDVEMDELNVGELLNSVLLIRQLLKQ